MTKHTITIEIDVPDEMLAMVHDAAHTAMALLRQDFMQRGQNYRQVAHIMRDDPSGKVLVAVKETITRESHALSVVSKALSEITHTMSDANSEWLRSKGA